MNALPTFSVIVPTYNRPKALGECLAALAAMDYPRDRFEVIVVDDGGRDDPTALVESRKQSMNVRLLRQPNAGPSVARNTGVSAAVHEFLAFTDDDCLPNPDWLQKLADAMGKDPEVIVGGLCINAFPKNLCCVASQLILDVVNLHFNRDHQNSIFFPSDNIAMRRDRFLELGGFDPDFRCAEDRDLCDRWAAAGRRLVFRADVVVHHARDMNFIGFCRQHFWYGRGAWLFHHARSVRKTGTFEVDGNFYFKCFRQPWRTEPVWRAIPLTALMCIWQVTNTAGFIYEKFTPKRSAGTRGNAAGTPGRSTSPQAERASR